MLFIILLKFKFYLVLNRLCWNKPKPSICFKSRQLIINCNRNDKQLLNKGKFLEKKQLEISLALARKFFKRNKGVHNMTKQRLSETKQKIDYYYAFVVIIFKKGWKIKKF